MAYIGSEQELRQSVERIVRETPVLDVHTHLYAPAFGKLLLQGVDELLTYHYLVAECMLHAPVSYERFWAMTTREQADLIWQTLFVERAPISEATLGVLTALQNLGFDMADRDLGKVRAWFEGQDPAAYIDHVLDISKVRAVVMTNDPLEDTERALWESGAKGDSRFLAALRIDPVLLGWKKASSKLEKLGYAVNGPETMAEVRRFLLDWARRMEAVYMAVSLPDRGYAAGGWTDRLIREAVVPVCMELNIPFAMMIGPRRQVNPLLRLAGDGMGRADLSALESLCRDFPKAKFMATLLSMENQHELTVLARKFRNLLIFGCWWFLNDPGFIEQITRMRVELLGTAFVPQHSDARVIDQLLYKWPHSRRVIGQVLAEKYALAHAAGFRFTEQEMQRDVERMFGGNFLEFCKKEWD